MIKIIVVLTTLFLNTTRAEDLYRDKIQPIFDNRCIACHSCYDAPCQLNLQAYDGFVRGATKELVYNGYRLTSDTPTRMWIDAFGEAAWRKKKFYSVNNSSNPGESIFYQYLAHKKDGLVPRESVANSNSCAADKGELKSFFKDHPDKGMPYGLPGLKGEELQTIKKWIEVGAPGPKAHISQHEFYQKDLLLWEEFLNKRDNEHKLVARYMYEHLFLAHITFDKDSREFFRLIRSSRPCDQKGPEIHTRTPNEDPETKEVYYCFKPNPGSIVAKTHIPLVFTKKKLKRYQDIFFKTKWTVTKLPDYDRQVAANPFVAFKDIPTKARYEYLLEDARYHVNTFIKGPVCNGSAAVNSIQEHFFVSFIAPDSDLMILSEKFEKESRESLLLPGVYGSNVRVNKTPMLSRELTERRESYRHLKKKWLKKLQPEGLSLNDIWQGLPDKREEGFLTVFRHDDNAVVLHGYVGDLSKTLFFLDYALFERLVYNLVVNFDVFGNISHQMLTRVYMDLIRMEAEENFLAFMPPLERKKLRDSWYRGYLTKIKMDYIYPDVLDDIPVNIKYQNPANAKKEFVDSLKAYKNEAKLFPLALSRPGKNNFANFFPELTLVRVKGPENRVFSIVRNREHENVSWILAEEYRLAPEEDSLSLVNGFAGTYPNLFLEVPSEKLSLFFEQIKALNNQKDFHQWAIQYGVARTDPRFWDIYDSLNETYLTYDSLEAGFLDLTRYGLK